MSENKKLTEDFLRDYMEANFNEGYEDLVNKMKGTPQEILSVNESIKDLIDSLGKKMTYTQLRTLHNELQKADSLTKLANTIHKLVYIEARQDKNEIKAFVRFVREFMEYIIKQEKEEDIRIKDTFIDTIVANHKLYA